MSCLFHSLSKFISINSDELRQIICNYISQNPILFDSIKAQDVILWENGMNFEDYVRGMRYNTTWGGAIEMKAFCDIYKIQVNVHVNNRVISFHPTGEIIKIININWNGIHFSIN